LPALLADATEDREEDGRQDRDDGDDDQELNEGEPSGVVRACHDVLLTGSES
jgi:hypothetical protein